MPSTPATSLHRIRQATTADLAAIERIVHDAYCHYIDRIGATPGPMRDDYRQRISQGQTQVLEDDAGVQAVLVLVREPDCLLLDNVAVSPAAQGKGYGRELMQWAEIQARQAGYRQIRLYTQESMTENIGIYQRYGYVETHRAEEIGLKRVFMAKSLR